MYKEEVKTKEIRYAYYNSGRIKSVEDNSKGSITMGLKTEYDYDIIGRKTTENTSNGTLQNAEIKYAYEPKKEEGKSFTIDKITRKINGKDKSSERYVDELGRF